MLGYDCFRVGILENQGVYFLTHFVDMYVYGFLSFG